MASSRNLLQLTTHLLFSVFSFRLLCAVPPSVPEITDEQGRVVNSQQIESWLDRFLVLRCRVTGGKPPPELTWFINDQKILSQTVETFIPHLQPQHSLLENNKLQPNWMSRSRRQITTNNVRIDEIRLGPLRRHHQGSRLTCQASNSQMNSPKRTSFLLELQRKLWVAYGHISAEWADDCLYTVTLYTRRSVSILTDILYVLSAAVESQYSAYGNSIRGR